MFVHLRSETRADRRQIFAWRFVPNFWRANQKTMMNVAVFAMDWRANIPGWTYTKTGKSLCVRFIFVYGINRPRCSGRLLTFALQSTPWDVFANNDFFFWKHPFEGNFVITVLILRVVVFAVDPKLNHDWLLFEFPNLLLYAGFVRILCANRIRETIDFWFDKCIRCSSEMSSFGCLLSVVWGCWA